jgi:uncharacterized protein (TIGR00730 family)
MAADAAVAADAVAVVAVGAEAAASPAGAKGAVRVAVYCGSSRRSPEIYLEAARETGRVLASRGHTLVYGGGRTGLMGAVADAALESGGRVEGVIYDRFIESDVHHRGLHVLTQVPDMRTRKAGLDERSDAFLVLAGGLGTLEELAEILSFRKLGFHSRPFVILNTRGFYDGLIAQLERFIEDDFDKPAIRNYLHVVDDPTQAIAHCESADRTML